MVIGLGDGVNQGVHFCINNDHRERISLKETHLNWHMKLFYSSTCIPTPLGDK